MSERFLVTGAHGFIGASIIAELVRKGSDVVAFDVAPGHRRARLLLNEAELERVRVVQGEIADPASVAAAYPESDTWCISPRCSTRTAATTTSPARASTSSAPSGRGGARPALPDRPRRRVTAEPRRRCRSRVTFEDAPFAATPVSFDGRALDAALGGVEWRPLEQGVRATVFTRA